MIAALLLCASLNANPTFDVSPDSLPGWTLVGAARYVRDGDGRLCVLADEGAVKSDLFPVAGGTEIKVTLEGSGPKYLRKRKKVWVAVAFFGTEEEARAKGAQWKLARPTFSAVNERFN